MISLVESIYESLNNKGKIKAIGDKTTQYFYQRQIKNEIKYYKEIKDSFIKNEKPSENDLIDGISKVWSPGEMAEYNGLASRYIAHYMLKNMNLKCVWAGITNNQKFTIYYLPADSKARYSDTYVESDENVGYNTNGGFHGDESNILWLNKNIKSRKDFAKIVMETINKIKTSKT